MWTGLTLQRHLIALLNFAPVESRFGSCKRRGKATFDIPINPCARSACSRSVAVGLLGNNSSVKRLRNLLFGSRAQPKGRPESEGEATSSEAPGQAAGEEEAVPV